MARFLLILGLLMSAFLNQGFAAAPAVPRHLVKADVLPLALEDAFQFRKTSIFINDPKKQSRVQEQMLNAEHDYINFGAVEAIERQRRFGEYFRFFWRAERKTALTVRFEYRQENLGNYVQAQEVDVPVAKGTMETKFQVTGDDYLEDGRITSWRAVLIENGKIVGLTQSFLWH
jgi:hypothetical protein